MSRNDVFDGWTSRADDAYQGYLRQCGAAFVRAADALAEAQDGGLAQRAGAYNRAAMGLAFDVTASWVELGTRLWGGLPSSAPTDPSAEKRTKRKK